MELKTSNIVAVLASCMVLVQSFALPMSAQNEENQMTADKRPKYMETRRDLSYFKDLLLFALDELIDEGKINPNVLMDPEITETQTAEKRGRHLGICVQVTPSGSYVPRPCWKREEH